ncbi:DUF397 domain-containing protein [Streptomyces turgidiscabies]|uniref:Putative toxin-antitoxin system, toxin component n=1 Tax=Streptomyces turgidiscabies (strain Car8) TaxID=698760 RepID=L7FJE4_STRT8|nr:MULTISPECIES: DUF397 domain-containing protein [Streptomyces]ELP71196.1 putative toxin-antitoxin system, toxin component [Streptomyces turgidiscabies Car8]MDX3492558.1 DUF397 domain-containing protein [Streptomyces turgidiscabies]GAQ69145.1 hypothetical protein T45_00867 [Streptomyces turgidiscabies]
MTEQLQWFKSSYSDNEGGNCVEVALAWFKSSYSDSEGGACVEVALPATRTTVHIRDSKIPAGRELHITASAWTAFISAAQPGA